MYLIYHFPHNRYVEYNNALPYNRINELIDIFDGFVHKLFNEQTDNNIDWLKDYTLSQGIKVSLKVINVARIVWSKSDELDYALM